MRNRFGWAAEQIANERARGNKVLLITASPDYLVDGLVRGLPFDAVICSKMDKKRPWKYEFLEKVSIYVKTCGCCFV